MTDSDMNIPKYASSSFQQDCDPPVDPDQLIRAFKLKNSHSNSNRYKNWQIFKNNKDSIAKMSGISSGNATWPMHYFIQLERNYETNNVTITIWIAEWIMNVHYNKALTDFMAAAISSYLSACSASLAFWTSCSRSTMFELLQELCMGDRGVFGEYAVLLLQLLSAVCAMCDARVPKQDAPVHFHWIASSVVRGVRCALCVGTSLSWETCRIIP